MKEEKKTKKNYWLIFLPCMTHMAKRKCCCSSPWLCTVLTWCGHSHVYNVTWQRDERDQDSVPQSQRLNRQVAMVSHTLGMTAVTFPSWLHLCRCHCFLFCCFVKWFKCTDSETPQAFIKRMTTYQNVINFPTFTLHYQPWHNPLWSTGLTTPANQLTLHNCSQSCTCLGRANGKVLSVF